MKRKYCLTASAIVAVAIWVGLIQFLGEKISGGERIDNEIIAALQTNLVIRGYFGCPLQIERRMKRRVVVNTNGIRNGIYTFYVKGTLINRLLKKLEKGI